MRARRLAPVLAAAVALTVAFSGLAAPGAGAQTADQTAAQVDTAQAAFDALNAQAQQATAELTAGTQRLEEGRARQAAAVAQAAAARAAADDAARRAVEARERLADVVGAAYRSPQPSDMSIALAAGVGGLGDALLATQDLDHVRGNTNDVLEEADAARLAADAASAQADSLEKAARDQAAALEVQVADLSRQAEEVRGRLEAAAAALRAVRLQQAQQQALIDASGGLALCTGENPDGYPNGFLPPEALCPLTVGGGHRLRADAAAAFNRLYATRPICVTDSYRSYGEQVDVYARKPGLAAVPGTSNHGLGLAVDLCGGIDSFGTEPFEWMKANAPAFGFVHPSWAEPGGSRPEPWHWEYVGVPGQPESAPSN